MKVLIIDDELVATQRLTGMLREIDREIEITDSLDSVESAVAYFTDPKELDLIFMDIELGDGQSFDIFKEVQTETPIVFITAYQEHTLKAFKLNSIDYLLKPLNKEELTGAILKYKKHGHKETGPDINMAALSKNIKGRKEIRSRFLARVGTKFISVTCDQIAYFYTKDKLQFIKTIKNENLIIDKRLDEIEAEVDSSIFFRANRQFIINYNYIEKVHAWFSGKLKVQLIPAAYEDIIVSRLRAADFKKWLGE